MLRRRFPCEMKFILNFDGKVSLLPSRSEDEDGEFILVSPLITLRETALQLISRYPEYIPAFLEESLVQMLSDGVDLYLKHRSLEASSQIVDVQSSFGSIAAELSKEFQVYFYILFSMPLELAR